MHGRFNRIARATLYCLGCSATLLGTGWGVAQIDNHIDWPTLHGDLQRSGFYSDFPRGKLRLKWRHDLSAELTGPRAEIIVGGGLAFMGTYAGNFYAWDAVTGEQHWRLALDSPIGHSPVIGGRSVYVAAMDGSLRSIELETGTSQWTARAPAGFWTAPTFAEGWVFIGDRAGIFHAYDARSGGKEVWQLTTEGPIVAPASVTKDGGSVIFASEDMHVYCCQTNNGSLAWRSRKLPGLTVRDYAPTIVGGLVIVTTNPVIDFHAIMSENEQMLIQRAGFQGRDARFISGSPDDVVREQDFIVEWLQRHPEEKCFHALDLEDGSEPWVAPILYSGGCHNPMTPPCFNPHTREVFVHVRSAYGVWDGGSEVRSFTGFGRLDLKTGRVSLLNHGYAPKVPGRPPGAPDFPWSSFNYIGDETQALSCASGWLFSNHQGFLGAMNLETGMLENRWGKRDSYGGFFGPAEWGWETAGGPEKAAAAGEVYALINEWHGPARSIASAADGRVYYHSGGQVICLESEQP
ncbi:MAG: PQQ-binding-like beta-propeller repeat protein [Verrucomicrobiales bacterium]